MIVDVVIPAYNEEDSIALVLADIPQQLVREVVVCDNASSDDTARVARWAGATVVEETRKGYGSACLKALSYIEAKEIVPDIIVFLDADYSDYPQQMHMLIDQMAKRHLDLVIGSRALGERERGSMMPQQIFGNWLATFLIRLLYGYRFSDLGPFRAIRYESLKAINMQDRDFGWTVEMQVKAAQAGLKCGEVAVNYRKRIGTSKVSGTIKGTIMAGYKIIWTIMKHR